jgi:hypothetical protein
MASGKAGVFIKKPDLSIAQIIEIFRGLDPEKIAKIVEELKKDRWYGNSITGAYEFVNRHHALVKDCLGENMYERVDYKDVGGRGGNVAASTFIIMMLVPLIRHVDEPWVSRR